MLELEMELLSQETNVNFISFRRGFDAARFNLS